MKDPKSMAVGQWGKQSGDMLSCADCGREVGSLYNLADKAGNEKKVCEGCYKSFWLEKGYKV